MGKRGRKPMVDSDTIKNVILNHDLYQEGKVKSKSNIVWVTICEELGNKILPVNLFFKFLQDRDNIQTFYRKEKGLEEVPGEHETTFFHASKFPKDHETKLAWSNVIGRKNWISSSSAILNREHFEEKYIDRNSDVEIHNNATPSIFKKPKQPRKTVKYSLYDENEKEELFKEIDRCDSLDKCDHEWLEVDVNKEIRSGEDTEPSDSDCPEFTEENLICMIRHYPVLYDKFDPDHGKKNKQNKIWKILSYTFNSSVTECQQHWKALLLKYKSQRDVIHKLRARGHKAKSKWPLYNTLSFLNDHLDEPNVALKKNYKVALQVNYKQDESEVIKKEYEPDLNGEWYDMIEISHVEEISSNNTVDIPEYLLQTEDSKMSNQEHSHSVVDVANHTAQSSLLQISNNSSTTKTVSTDVNEDVQFLNSLLPVLGRMTRKKKALCKSEIMALLANYESEDEPS